MLKRLASSEKPETPEDLVSNEERLTLVLNLNGQTAASNAKPGDLFDGVTKVEQLSTRLRGKDYKRLRDALSRASRIGATAPPTVVVADISGGALMHLAVVPTEVGDRAQVFMVLRAIAPKWTVDLRSVLMNVFDLTNRECEIIEGLCSNENVSDLAERDGRSVHTIRTQVKTVLSKTGATSQTSLVRLVSGLSTLSGINSWGKQEGVAVGRRSPIELPDGRWIELYLHGPVGGRPVIFIHGMLDGIGISPEVDQELYARNIRWIAPVRASFGRSDPLHDIEAAPRLFAEDLRSIMDHLDVRSAPVIGHMAGSVYAFAAATYLPDRITAVINVSGGIPIRTRQQFLLMTPRQKVVALTARYTPSLLPLIVNAGISQIKSGMERRLMEALYKDAPHDLHVARRPEVFALLRARYRFTVEQGDTAFITDAAYVTRDWSELVAPITQPVQLIHGARDPVVRIETVREFVAEKPEIRLDERDDAGQLLFYQMPEVVLNAVETAVSKSRSI
ncbi:MAG: alpha/beta hydrolase [Pseudomonadota bacterium]